MLRKIIILLFLLGPVNVHAQEADTLESYTNYLRNVLDNDLPDDQIAGFYTRSRTFWIANKIGYNKNPEKYGTAMELYHRGQEKFPRNRTIKIDRFENTIEMFRRFDRRNTLSKHPILFVGSSSIVYWETARSFPEYPVVNRGFGGASLPEIIYYYDDVIKIHNPSMMVVYCDIDVENGKSPDFAVDAFKKLVVKVEEDFSDIPILFYQ